MFIVWRGFLYNQIDAILSQYEMEVYEVTKGRGTYICNTSKGKFVLTGFRGSKEKGDLLREYLSKLKNHGFIVEQIEINKNGEAVTVDEETGERYILKDYIAGPELNVNRVKELKDATTLLAEYHNISNDIEWKELEGTMLCAQNVKEEKARHYRELIKARNYMRSKKKKNDFERIYLSQYDGMFQIAKKSLDLLEKETEDVITTGIGHGDYNQHNVLFVDGHWQIVNFENFGMRWCILDVANFLRKMLEKNDWEINVGVEIIDAYRKKKPLTEADWEKLYALLLFPEKFWKVTNHYMNSRKTWISQRDIEKLKKVIEQEGKRLHFMQNLFAIQEE